MTLQTDEQENKDREDFKEWYLNGPHNDDEQYAWWDVVFDYFKRYHVEPLQKELEHQFQLNDQYFNDATELLSERNKLKIDNHLLENEKDGLIQENRNLRISLNDVTESREEWKDIAVKASNEVDKLKSENENLVSVMIAAAEEIQEHWQAHCDEEGYGPQNLMMRLEKGIPANYPGYKFGAFTKMQEEIEHLQALLRNRDAYIETLETKKD